MLEYNKDGTSADCEYVTCMVKNCNKKTTTTQDELDASPTMLVLCRECESKLKESM